jgi:release factor glutamine methyltransferase
VNASPTIAAILQYATTTIAGVSDTARLDAELLLANCLSVDRSHFYAWPEKPLDSDKAQQFQQAVARRAQGEPVAYITGFKEFWSMPFAVNRDTLIPRPETELLVELALSRFDENPDGCKRVLDLGTGSGAIAVAMALERPAAIVHATDNSEAALAVAKQNATQLGASITFYISDWLENVPEGLYQLVISNPPYIEPGDPHLQQASLRYEPQQALVADDNGMADISIIANSAFDRIENNGWLLLEHGAEQGALARDCLRDAGYVNVSTNTDLEQRDRVTRGQKRL